MTYGNGKTLSVSYNARLAPASYQIPSVLDKSYQYFDDGSLKSTSDLLDNRYDRAMQYDPVGRLTVAKTGTEARGSATPDGPFNQTYQYDAFGHTTARTSRQWTSTFGDSGTYQNERRNGWSYDADGNVTNNTDVQFTYDAAGLPAQTVNLIGGSISAHSFDGDGQRIRSAFQLNSSAAATTKYYLRATPLGGQVVADLLSTGEKAQGYVYAGKELMAVQRLPVTGDSANYVVWRHAEPSGSVRGTDEGGGQNWAAELNSAELDATGVDMKREDPGPDQFNTLTDENNPDFHAMGNPSRLSGGCSFNGIPIADCGFLMKSSSFDKFNLVAGAVTASARIVGTRTITTHWHIQLGGSPMDDVDSDRVIVNSNDFSWSTEKTIPIYDSGSFSFVSALNRQSQPQNTSLTARPAQKLTGCIFDIAITTNGLLYGKQIRAMKDEITRIFATAGQEINFVTNNEKANYHLTINDVGANYTNNADAVGLTPLNGSVVTNNGRVFVDRLTTSATQNPASSTAFNQNSNGLAIGLGRAGSHEIAHNLLQQNYDSPAITGVMHNGFKGSEWFGKSSEGLWKFTPAQIKQLNSLCGR